MSKKEVAENVLEVIRTHQQPVDPTYLFNELSVRQISKAESRRAIVELADKHKINITSDRKLTLA